ncbi:hypothetical protein K432DRAFT_287008, partial [Lepidopterella palustris CBS 459.81]
SGINLSGLLNVIDGNSAGEDRVLIMTTNNPESLDKALICPGQINTQVFSRLVSQKAASNIFL